MPQQVDQVATPGGGTGAVVVDVQPGRRGGIRADRALCRQQRRGGGANVDVANEAVQQATAAYDFAMNAQVMRVYSQMTKTLLDVQA